MFALTQESRRDARRFVAVHRDSLPHAPRLKVRATRVTFDALMRRYALLAARMCVPAVNVAEAAFVRAGGFANSDQYVEHESKPGPIRPGTGCRINGL